MPTIEEALRKGLPTNITRLKLEKLIQDNLLRSEFPLLDKLETNDEEITSYRVKNGVPLRNTKFDFLESQAELADYIPLNPEQIVCRLDQSLECDDLEDWEIKFQQNFGTIYKQLILPIISRTILPTTFVFHSKNYFSLFANLRLSNRSQTRWIRQLKTDSESGILEKYNRLGTNKLFAILQRGWQFAQENYVASEEQKISNKLCRFDFSIHLGKYTEVYENFKELLEGVNEFSSVDDSNFVNWVRNILCGKPFRVSVEESILPPRIKNYLVQFLVDFTHLFFGIEVVRNPASLIIHQMILDLINERQLTWEELFTGKCDDEEVEKPILLPMALPGAPKKIRRLYQFFDLSMPRKYVYDCKQEDGINFEDIIQREYKIIAEWYKHFKEENQNFIEALLQRCQTHWYPGIFDNVSTIESAEEITECKSGDSEESTETESSDEESSEKTSLNTSESSSTYDNGCRAFHPLTNRLSNLEISKGGASVTNTQGIDSYDRTAKRYGIFSEETPENQRICALLSEELSETDRSLATALGEGDCFFDAVAQALNEAQETNVYTVESLRRLCNDYAQRLEREHPVVTAIVREEDIEANWLFQSFREDTALYQEYLIQSAFTSEEANLMRERFRVGDGIAIWGELHIDARIICQELNVSLHVIEVRPESSLDVTDIPVIMHQLVNRDGVRQIDNPIELYNDTQILHIAVSQNHFVPILRNTTLSQSNERISIVDSESSEIDSPGSCCLLSD